MANHRRRTLHDVIDRIISRGKAVEFFQLVRLLERLLDTPGVADSIKGSPYVGQSSPDKSPRIQFHGDPAHHARMASTLPLDEVPQPDSGLPVDVWTTFMNLVGTTGVLPDHYTTLVLERLKAGDTALRDYLDIFHHRLTELAYQVWEKSRPDVWWERSQLQRDAVQKDSSGAVDPWTSAIQCLAGETNTEQEDSSRSYFAAFFADIRRPALSLQSMLRICFHRSATIQQFAARVVRIPDESCWHLPIARSAKSSVPQLGRGLVLGRRLPMIQTRFLVQFGPLEYSSFQAFLPNGPNYLPLKKLIRSYVGMEFEFDIQLFLLDDEVPEFRPDSNRRQMRLGWNTWLAATKDKHVDRQIKFLVKD